MASRVLIVEDEPDIRELLGFHLEREGYHVMRASTGTEALRQVRHARPDLVILDLMLPEMDGLEVCRRLRAEAGTAGVPVIMLTAKGDEVDRVVGLEMGADDYVVKPFSPKEVLARVRAVLRRSRGPVTAAPLTVGGIALDEATHQASAGGQALSLTPKEFDLLRALLEARGRVLSREFLLDRVWGYARADEIESRTVDVHVRRLRAKLGPEGQRILTVKNVGYRLDPDA
ncbi:MAG TPA: response regulator [Methylomirabilota bacterium]|nr:response regulator [Methylomirabilota bacterium]